MQLEPDLELVTARRVLNNQKEVDEKRQKREGHPDLLQTSLFPP